ncbi:MAG: 30S ribosomal protein S17 [Alphaproteobacteria bacterium]
MPRRMFKGVVVSDKNDKTIIVRVEKNIMHPLYKKYIKRHRKYVAHDPDNSYKIGDVAKIVESRPLSKTKKWVVVEKNEEQEGVG